MDIGFIGLGKMGMNMVTRLSQGGHRVVAYDRSATLITEAETKGATAASSLEDLIAKLPKPRSRMGHGAFRPTHRRDRATSRDDPGQERYHHRWRQYQIS